MAGESIAILGTLDTKGEEIAYLRDQVAELGLQVVLVDVGVLGQPALKADLTREEVAAAGGFDLKQLVDRRDPRESTEAMMIGAAKVVAGLYERGRLQGVLAIGGAKGTAIGMGAMSPLALGVPKVMLTSAGDLASFGEIRDIVLMPTVVDLLGLNAITRRLLRQAATLIASMVRSKGREEISKPIVGMTSFGATTPAVMKSRQLLEGREYEVVTFPATGAGGRALEETVQYGGLSGVVDLTLSELADELVGGILSAGPNRLEAAGKVGIPQVVVPGAIDMVNFGMLQTVPSHFKDRKLHQHAPTVTLMRTTANENAELGTIVAAKLNRASSPVAVVIPLRGFSAYDREGEVFFDPEADTAFVRSLERHLEAHIQLIQVDCHINDNLFAERTVDVFCKLAQKAASREEGNNAGTEVQTGRSLSEA